MVTNMTYISQQTLQKTAFGELSTAQQLAYIQIVPVYNLLPPNFNGYNSGSGSYSVTGKMFNVQSGTSEYGYGAIQSFRALNYRTGQGGMARFTAVFPTNVANSQQGVGLITLSDELSFGYNGTSFGVWYRTGGYAEVREITVTVGAGGSESATLTLNSVAYTIPLTVGSTQNTAYQIATWLNANQSVWDANQIDTKVIVSSESDGAKSGTYSFSSATATATIASKTVGVTKTSTHIPQTELNLTILKPYLYSFH